MPFEFRPTRELPEVILVVPQIFRDARGHLFPAFSAAEFAAHGIAGPFVRDLVSRSTQRGVVRGLHHQNPPAAEGKLVRATRGAVYDVAVDLRRGSPRFGRWTATELTAENAHALWIPPGFAHGFCSLTDEAELHYKITSEYSPAHEGSVRWDDPALAIPWPTKDPLLSDRDARAPLLADARIEHRYA